VHSPLLFSDLLFNDRYVLDPDSFNVLASPPFTAFRQQFGILAEFEIAKSWNQRGRQIRILAASRTAGGALFCYPGFHFHW
jgi:hypothetical protein